MATFAITGVRLDGQQRIVRAAAGRVNPATNTWIAPPVEMDASDLANHIAIGDEVVSIFGAPGGTVLGPKFKRVTYSNGTEGIELAEDVPGKGVAELVKVV